jgi:uridine kinase
MTLESLLAYLSDLILQVHRPHPLRVAVDGIDAAGKTFLADRLVVPLEARGRPVLRASIDGFHRPRAERYLHGCNSPEGYYADSFDYDSLKAVLLIPLGLGGDHRCRLKIFDYHTDTHIHEVPQSISTDAVLLMDGVFLLRPELNAYWDFRIFLQVDFDVVLQRAILRDQYFFGSPHAVEERYQQRYFPAQRFYLQTVQPCHLADVIIDNNNLDHPRIISALG